MKNLATNILQVIEPDLNLLRVDVETKLEEDYKFGEFFPLIWVNDMYIAHTGISNFEIDLSGFIPTFNLTLNDDIDQFSSVSMPKKQDILSVLIKDMKQDFNPIKANFTVDNISSFSGSVSLSGTLFIPGFDKKRCVAYKEKTTHEVIESIAMELGLGFATNEDLTNDLQNWIIPFKKFSEFLPRLKNYIYKDENMNYYEIFIDIYYNINLVNIPKLFEGGLEDEDIETFVSVKDSYMWESRMADDDYEEERQEESSIALFLTNMQDYVGNNNYFERFDFENSTGSTYKSLGINKILKFYDLDEKVYYNHDLSLDFEKDEELGELIVQDEEMDNFVWSGVSNDNNHLNYDWINFQSTALKSFYERNLLKIKLNRANFFLHRYIKIPIQIWTLNSFDRDYLSELETLQGGSDELQPKIDGEGPYSTSEENPIMNKFLSGYYTMKDYRLGWNGGDNQFYQECSFIKPLYVNVVNKIEESNAE